MQTRTSIKYGRQVMAAVINPTMRGLLAGNDDRKTTPGHSGDPLSRFEWVKPDGSIDTAALRDAAAAFDALLTDRAILEFGPIRNLPSDEAARTALSLELIRTVFDRLGPAKAVSEDRLNAALAMLVEDPAVVRRDAVDSGYLDRTADGRRYSLPSGRTSA